VKRLLKLALAVWVLRWAAMEVASHAHRILGRK
jgi:hypothetical protein